MAKEMLINVSEGEECRIALIDSGKLEELYMERTSSTSHVGNIYKGRVTNVEPSIQAAFVDFGLGRNGFLHISDLMPTYFGQKGEDIQEAVGRKMARRDRPPIQRCLRRGDEIIVQIIKEGIGTKGPTLSTYLSIPGRILVMMPGMSKFGISRKIEDDVERRRLRGILDSLKPIKDVGFIIRTAGVGKTKTEIQRDLTYLTRLWQNMQKKLKQPAPQELYTEGDLVARTVRDVFSSDVQRIVVDNKEVAKKIKEFFKIAMPRTRNKVELYDEPIPIFHKYNIERDIEQMYTRHVSLPSGGSLVIDSTEAIVAIDVNSGKFRDHSDAEMTAFKTDLEAADEIPRQLRLRDLGGVIICDFIDLRYERHRRELEKRLHDNLKNDRAKTKVLRMSQFGIIEMTRQRMRPSLKRSIYFDCPHCKGAGLVKTPESMSLDVMRRLAIAASDQRVARVELAVCPDVGFYLLNRKRRQLAEMEAGARKKVVIRQDATLGLDEMKLVLFDTRDGLVYLDALGMSPHEPSAMEHRRGSGRRDRRDDRQGRAGGRPPRGQPVSHREAPRFEQREIEREPDEDQFELARTETESAAVDDLPPQSLPSAPASAEAIVEVDDSESNVIEVDQPAEPMGEGPDAYEPEESGEAGGGDRKRGRRRGRRGGRGRNRTGGGNGANQQTRPAPRPQVAAAKAAGDSNEEEFAEKAGPGNESHPHGKASTQAGAEGDEQHRRRRRRGGRRHRRRRENAAARAAGGEAPPVGRNAQDADDRSEEASSVEDQTEFEPPPSRPSAPARTPPPPVVRTGSTDRHIVDDEPVDPQPVRRPRSYRDLDAIPDDLE